MKITLFENFLFCEWWNELSGCSRQTTVIRDMVIFSILLNGSENFKTRRLDRLEEIKQISFGFVQNLPTFYQITDVRYTSSYTGSRYWWIFIPFQPGSSSLISDVRLMRGITVTCTRYITLYTSTIETNKGTSLDN